MSEEDSINEQPAKRRKVEKSSDVDDNSSKGKDKSHKHKDKSHKTKDKSHKSKDKSSKVKDKYSKEKDKSHKGKDKSYKVKDRSHKERDNASKVKESSSNENEILIPCETHVTQPKEWAATLTSPKADTESAVPEKQSPIAEKQSPIAEKQSPIAEKQSPIAEKQSLIAEKQSPIAEKQSPIAEKQSPIAEELSPIAANQYPIVEKQSPTAQKESPIDKIQSPLAEKQCPVAKKQSITEKHCLITEKPSVITEKDSPVAKSGTPLAEKDSHIAEKDSSIAETNPIPEEDSTNTAKDPFEASCSADTFNSFVTAEEVEKLRQFHVLDEVKSNDEDSNDENSDDSDGKSVELPEEEIERMLDEDLPEELKGAPRTREKPFITRQKIVLEEKGVNHFEVLPLDWIMVRHMSGMPIYMHRSTRVCTLSKPYFLGKNNSRRHDIPISAIPCYAYRRALEEEAKQKEIDRKIQEQIENGTWAKTIPQQPTTNACNGPSSSEKSFKPTEDTHEKLKSDMLLEEAALIKEEILEGSATKCPFSNGTTIKEDEKPSTIDDKDKENSASATTDDIPLNRQPVVLPGGIVMPPPRVETINTSWKTQHLTADQINDYCKKLFIFKTVNIMHFKRWADRRKYTKARKTLQYPTLPEGTKLITIPAQAQPSGPGQENGGKSTKRDWVMNMNDRSYLSVFHEYVCRALQKQPIYHFKQLENASQPYQATVYIGGMQYGVGYGSSKRQAKSAAARASIHILIPEMKDELDAADPRHVNDTQSDFHDFFDLVGIEDPRITEFCAATCEPSPHAILRTCLLRNFGAGDRHIHTEMKKLEFQKIELTMKVGKHTASVICKNKKTAKQRASQAILQALHPHVRSWGSLLRLYGSKSVKSCKEKKLEEQQITLLQDKARHNEPNYAVLEKLRHEMRKLRERDEAVVPIGTLLVKDDLPTHSGSNLNNVDL